MLTNLLPCDLANVLRASATTPAESAGIEMIALYGHWLTRPDFVKDGLRGDRDTGAARVAWRELGQFMYPQSPEVTVLQLACVLAGELPYTSVGKRWTIGALLGKVAGDPVACSAASVALLGLTEGRWAA